MADPTGEKRKADSDAEDMEDTVGQGSPIRSRVEEDEDIRRATALHPTCGIQQLRSVSSLATEAERLGMTTMDLEQWDIDIASNRDSITEWVRERKPAFIIGKPQSRTMGQIRFICGLCQLQVQEGRWFVHEQPANAAAWKMKEVVCSKKAGGVC